MKARGPATPIKVARASLGHNPKQAWLDWSAIANTAPQNGLYLRLHGRSSLSSLLPQLPGCLVMALALKHSATSSILQLACSALSNFSMCMHTAQVFPFRQPTVCQSRNRRRPRRCPRRRPRRRRRAHHSVRQLPSPTSPSLTWQLSLLLRSLLLFSSWSLRLLCR